MNAVIDVQLEGLSWRQDGCVALSGALYAWMRRFDECLIDHAEKSGCTDYRFPALIPLRDLQAIGYLRSFPHLATFAVRGQRDEATLRDIALEHGAAGTLPVDRDLFDPCEALLTPAACYHLYPQFAGQQITAPLMLTTRCQCFRCEDHYAPLQRQWAFEMREFVCIGDQPAIDEFAAARREFLASLLGRLGIRARWQPANDPFFDPESDPKALAQLVAPVKEELCLESGLAIASVNRHRAFFGEAYDIRIGDRAAESVCVALGMERWLHAMLQAHGSEVSGWPVPEVTA